MKQALLILSFIIVAFVAACSESITRIPAKTGNGSNMSVEQLAKASSDEELAKLKVQLENNKNVEIPDIIKVVKMKFNRFHSLKEPKSEDSMISKDITEKNALDEKLTKQSFNGIDMIDANSDPSLIYPTTVKNEESKHICIQTCAKQIIILQKKNDSGKVISVSAFVAAEISESNAVIITKTDRTLKAIDASFDIASDLMDLRFKMITKDKKEITLETEPFSVGETNLTGVAFSDLGSLESGSFELGTFDLYKINENKIIRMKFDSDKETINITLKDDLGVFGKNKATEEDMKSENSQIPSLNKDEKVRELLQHTKY